MEATATKTRPAHQVAPRDVYMEPVVRFPLKSLRSDREHRAALEILRELMLRDQDDMTADEADYLEVLSELVGSYEKAHNLMPQNKATEQDRLRSLVENAGMTASALGRLLGTRALGSMLLTGRRGLSKNHMRILAGHFKIDPGYFLL